MGAEATALEIDKPGHTYPTDGLYRTLRQASEGQRSCESHLRGYPAVDDAVGCRKEIINVLRDRLGEYELVYSSWNLKVWDGFSPPAQGDRLNLGQVS